MKNTLNENYLWNSPNSFLTNLYHFPEMNTIDISFKNQIEVHKILPNPSTKTFKVYNPDMEPT